MRKQVVIENRSGYATADLERFFLRGLRAMRVTKPLHITVVSSPIRSRGCAEIGGRRIVIAIASPSQFSLRRLARMYEHEVAHIMGLDHGEMPHAVLYSLGPIPPWAKGQKIRYVRRAPAQIPLLRYAYLNF